jgi:hypothetical protein
MVQGGKAEPQGAAEQFALAELCLTYKHQPATAVRFYTAGLADAASPTDELILAHRYNAACAAVLAAAGNGKEPGPLVESEKSRLRRQGLSWLHAELSRLQAQVKTSEPAVRLDLRKTLWHRQTDTNLAQVRGDEALILLPIEERAAWQQFWFDVDLLFHKARLTSP